MTLFSILETLLIGPLKLIFEVIFSVANSFIGHPGLSIIVLSLVMNILVLPLYKRADIMQEQSRDIEAKLQKGVSHIKKTFSGDEKMMILQAYYRQNNYKPTDALHGSVSLLLEIPFFMAAYQFLSHLDILDGVSLGPIKDLGAPDGLLVIGGFAINVLPFIMTLINFISSYLFLKGYPLKTKIQLYAMALFFLVFLYTSPSCLVFYWTLNNLFSLVKTIFYKLKNPRKIINIITTVVGIAFIVFGFIYQTDSIKRRIFLLGIGVALQLPMLMPLVKSKIKVKENNKPVENNKKLFVLGSLFLTVLVGLLIPSTFIAASPQEYVDVTHFHNPLWYIVSAVCMAAGTFLIWMRVFYWLASPKGKAIFDKLVWILCGVMLVNYMFFGTNLGIISANLQYENMMWFSLAEQLINIGVILAIAVVMYIIVTKWKKAVPMVLLVAVLAVGGMSAINLVTAKNSVDEITIVAQEEQDIPEFELSTEGQNVVVFMLDRAMGGYIPYLFNENPDLAKQFEGFTYYENTISHGGQTNFGTPGLFGGYEYTPVEMNKRDTETLATKQNEAIKMMPKLFSDNGFDVTVIDPVYANYQWVPDLSIYNDIEGVDAYIAVGKFGNVEDKESNINNRHRNFFCFSLMKTMPVLIQPTIYNNGNYHQLGSAETEIYSIQTQNSMSTANGVELEFMDGYNVLKNMPTITKITDSNTNTLLMMSNDTTHNPMFVNEADNYTPAFYVDNTEYDEEHADRFVVDGKELLINNVEQMAHYQSNMSALIQFGNWLDYLRENGVYDNTRIILVADHGNCIGQFDELILDDGSDILKDAQYYYPLLMVKDFNSDEFTTSTEFMTNADVPTLATQGVIENPVNPYTGKPINNDEKYAHEQYVILSDEWSVLENNGNTFLPAKWASVKDDIHNKNNWTVYDQEIALKQHSAP